MVHYSILALAPPPTRPPCPFQYLTRISLQTQPFAGSIYPRPVSHLTVSSINEELTLYSDGIFVSRLTTGGLDEINYFTLCFISGEFAYLDLSSPRHGSSCIPPRYGYVLGNACGIDVPLHRLVYIIIRNDGSRGLKAGRQTSDWVDTLPKGRQIVFRCSAWSMSK